MKTKLTILAFGVVFVPLLGAFGCRGFVEDKDFERFKASLGDTTMTVYPAAVRVGTSFEHDKASATAIARLIRSEKLATVTVSSDEVKITRGWHVNQARMLRETAEDFAAHLAAHPIETDYALLPEYLGGKKGFGGIQCNIIDRHGTPAFALVINSHSEAFAKKSPKSAADCTDVLLGGLRKHLAKGRD